MRNENGEKTDRNRKELIKIFKEIGFKIEIKINLKVVDFLDINFNLSNGTYKPYRKPNDKLLYANNSSKHHPEIIKQLPMSTAKRLSKNSWSLQIFNSAKVEYENALANSGYHFVKLNFTQTRENKPKHYRGRNIIWFNPPYNRNVITKVAKRFLNLLDHHFQKSNKLHKIFNRNTVKRSYSCTENISSIISSYNKKLMKNNAPNTNSWNCRTKSKCLLNGQCQSQGIIYKCAVSKSVNPDKVYLGTAEGDFKKSYHNQTKSFRNKQYTKDASLSEFSWEIKGKHQQNPTLKWSIVKRASAYSNITKKCFLCLNEKLEIINYPHPEEFLNKRSELVSMCRHAKKYLLKKNINYFNIPVEFLQFYQV